MRFRAAALLVVLGLSIAGMYRAVVAAPSPAGAAAAVTARNPANVQQLMRGVLFPNANVVFAAQDEDPAAVTPDAKPSAATDPLASVFGGWEAVANSALALTESATLLEIARPCSTGTPAPIETAAWKAGLADLREAGLVAWKAAQARSQDGILDATDRLAAACAACHQKYRTATRCVE